MTTSHCQPAQRLRREKKSPQVYSDFHGKHKLLKNILHALWDSETGIGLGNVNSGFIGPSASCAVEIACFLFKALGFLIHNTRIIHYLQGYYENQIGL